VIKTLHWLWQDVELEQIIQEAIPLLVGYALASPELHQLVQEELVPQHASPCLKNQDYPLSLAFGLSEAVLPSHPSCPHLGFCKVPEVMRRPLIVLKYDIHGCPILSLRSTAYKQHNKSNVLILPCEPT
jgi:hypothetical protein